MRRDTPIGPDAHAVVGEALLVAIPVSALLWVALIALALRCWGGLSA
jgi:hypothetical protein